MPITQDTTPAATDTTSASGSRSLLHLFLTSAVIVLAVAIGWDMVVTFSRARHEVGLMHGFREVAGRPSMVVAQLVVFASLFVAFLRSATRR